ncbi:outer membrane protein assembly factor BamB family protein [Pontibacter brevis]
MICRAVLLLTICVGCNGVVRQESKQQVHQSAADKHITWKDYGGGPDQSKYVVLDEITKANVNQLQTAWFYSTGDDNVYQFNPIVVDSVMYVLAKNNSLIALDATTGEEIWIHANLRGIARRGINYWESKDRKDRRLLFQMNDYLQAIDARTGKSILSFGENGLVDLKKNLGRDPNTIARVQSGTPGKVFENLILLGSSTGEGYFSAPGHVRAYNVVTGELAWTFHTIPQPGEYGYDTWPKDAYQYVGGVNTWGEISIDETRGIAYFPLGSPTYDYYGTDRIGSNLYGNSLLALDARTGKRLWHYQMVHHDLWDYDAAAAPQLVTVQHNGKKVDAVAQASKNGFLFVFDRVTGEPLWPIEERPVPVSEVPGEQAWPTQPFPTVVPPFARQHMTADDITPYFLTSEERVALKARIDSMQTGLYTPLSHKRETLALPGAVGGASWGNTAANPEQGMVYVLSIDWPSFYEKLEKREAASNEVKPAIISEVEGGQHTYTQYCQPCHGANRAGLVGPSLLDVGGRLTYKDFQHVVMTGRGDMPAFQHIDQPTMQRLYSFLKGETGKPVQEEQEEVTMPAGPVVASGGAPGGQELRRVGEKSEGKFGPLYPEGTDAPSVRYFTQGWGLGHAELISPPWSSLIAYDLNKGKIKWKVPIGLDQDAAAEGGKNTGVPRAQRNGMVVTSTGIVFSTAKDGKVYAFDADSGKVLWTGELPTGTEGLPAMYEVKGRHFLVVTATTPLKWAREKKESEVEGQRAKPQGGYVVFALPQLASQKKQ